MTMAATDQMAPISASIHNVPEPRSRPFLIPITPFANSLQTHPTRTVSRSPYGVPLYLHVRPTVIRRLIEEHPCPGSWDRPRWATAPSLKASASSNAAAPHPGQV